MPAAAITVRHPRWACTCLLALLLAPPAYGQTGDQDRDGLPDDWELQFGLNPALADGDDGAAGDSDGDGLSNAMEYATRSHPRGRYSRSFAEGATGDFFDVQFALFNASRTASARVLLRFFRDDGATVSRLVVVPPLGRSTVDPEALDGMERTAFATVVEADQVVIVDRTMSWDGQHYGGHAETGTPVPSTRWYLAEGATHSGFDLFYLLQNPGTATANVEVTYLRPSGAAVVRQYVVAPHSRANVWVDLEAPELASTDVSATIASSQPIVVERAMYLNAQGRLFGAGHVSAGVTTPSREWFLAEGATGAYFDLFVLVANPGEADADVAATYLLPDGTTVTRNHTVAGRSRYTIWVDQEDARLVDTSVSTTIKSTNGVPVIVERAMWWPGPTAATWAEAHGSPGVTASNDRWALAEGEEGGRFDTSTYVLVANTSPRAGNVRMTVFLESGGTYTRTWSVAANSRTTFSTRVEFPETRDRRFATLVESVDTPPLALVVERAMYANANGVAWAWGTVAVGTPLPPPGPDGSMGFGLPTVTLTAVDGAASEQGDTATFVARRDRTDGPLVVTYGVGGTAAAPSDFSLLPNPLTFATGVSDVTFGVIPVNDATPELPETVVLSLYPGSHYQVGTAASAQAIIADDDEGNVVVPASMVDAARFLTQATFGPNAAEIARIQSMGYEAWLNEQFAMPPSSFLAYLDAVTDEYVDEPHLQEAWVQHAAIGPDQLRQRVAHALLEVLVVSDHNGLQGASVELAAYMDVLMAGAFGNFRTLLEQVTLNPAMGKFLDMLKNDMEDPELGTRPNENYAREVLQLFSIGLHQLNPDGTPTLDLSGNLVPTYGAAEIEGFSRVFTGWTFYQTTKPYRFSSAKEDWRHPMVASAKHHSPREKVLLGGVVLPPFQTPEQDLADAMDNIFAHPNVGPFLARRLIQRLVTSNPSPGYVSRVAAVFGNNGAGVRGDLRAVVRAILLDQEARDLKTSRAPLYGKQREPMIRFMNVVRAFNMRATSGHFRVWDLYREIGQAAFKAPSVFNFFEPDFSPAGLVGDLGLFAPEFQITTESGVVAMANVLKRLVHGYYGPYAEDKLVPDFTTELALVSTPDALLDHLNTLLFSGGMSAELRGIVRDALVALSKKDALRRVRTAVILLVRSPEFAIQK
jgi:uncharacterized protein (DUF1800 family)